MSAYEQLLVPASSPTKYLIVPTEEMVRQFHQEIGGTDVLMAMDLQEIITQIVEAMLNHPQEFLHYQLPLLPNEDRLLDSNRIERLRLQKAVYLLGAALYEQLLQIGAIDLEGGLPYFFDRLIGCDIMLQRFDWL